MNLAAQIHNVAAWSEVPVPPVPPCFIRDIPWWLPKAPPPTSGPRIIRDYQRHEWSTVDELMAKLRCPG